jgi:hypothetical protein
MNRQRRDRRVVLPCLVVLLLTVAGGQGSPIITQQTPPTNRQWVICR